MRMHCLPCCPDLHDQTCHPCVCVQVFYDLKRLLEESKAAVPPELARSEAAKMKPGSISQKRDSIQYAKK